MHFHNLLLIFAYIIVHVLTVITLVFAEANSSNTTQIITNVSKNSNKSDHANTFQNDVIVGEQQVVVEGGGKINLKVSTMDASVNKSETHNKEKVTTKGPVISLNVTLAASSTPSTTLKSNTSSNSSLSSGTINSVTPTPHAIPIYENNSPVKNASENLEHKKISARKGVNFAEEDKVKVKKPLLTTGSDEEPFAPSHFKLNASANGSVPKVPNLNLLDDSNQGQTQKYVVPIVIVILSVPFVAILISIVYKRGSEWWRYRHYRRMDFLINGMYDN